MRVQHEVKEEDEDGERGLTFSAIGGVLLLPELRT